MKANARAAAIDASPAGHRFAGCRRGSLNGVALTVALLAIVALGCERTATAPPDVVATPSRFATPVTARLEQRSRWGVPEGEPLIMVQLGDVTKGRVEVIVRDMVERVIAGPRSMGVDEQLDFELGSEALCLRVSRLENALVGADFVMLQISLRSGAGAQIASPPVEGDASIEALLADLAAAKGVIYIRNGAEFSPAEAAAHLRTKWNTAGEQVATVEQFIELCGTKSSASGEPYRVRRADGRTITSAEFLRELQRARSGSR